MDSGTAKRPLLLARKFRIDYRKKFESRISTVNRETSRIHAQIHILYNHYTLLGHYVCEILKSTDSDGLAVALWLNARQ